MSVTTLKVGVRPGTEISRRLAARRDAMLGERERVRRARVRARAVEFETGRVPAARPLARLVARRDVVAREAGSRELAAADAAIRHAIHTGELVGLRDLIGRLELGAERAWTARTRQVLVLDQVARRLPSWLCLVAVNRGSDNVLRMHTRLEDGRELVIAASANLAEEGAQSLDFQLVGDDTHHTATELDTPSRWADAEAVTAAVCEHLRAKGVDLTSDGGKDAVIELGLAIIGFAMGAASFPTGWQPGAYIGVVLTAVAIGMLLARHFRRP